MTKKKTKGPTLVQIMDLQAQMICLRDRNRNIESDLVSIRKNISLVLSVESRLLKLEEQMRELHGLLDYEPGYESPLNRATVFPTIKIGWRRIGLKKVAEHFKRVFV